MALTLAIVMPIAPEIRPAVIFEVMGKAPCASFVNIAEICAHAAA